MKNWTGSFPAEREREVKISASERELRDVTAERERVGEKCEFTSIFSSSHFSFDVRGNGVEIGRHWNDGINLGAR